MEVRMFPEDVLNIIVDYAAVPHLLDWIPKDKLDMDLVMRQPLSFEAGFHGLDHVGLGKPEYIAKVMYGFVDVTRRIGNTRHALTWIEAWSDPNIIEQLLTDPLINEGHISWIGLAMNPHPMAVQLTLKNLSSDSTVLLRQMSRNPAMIHLLIECPTVVDHEMIWANQHDIAIEHISKMPLWVCNWYALSQNSHPWAINTLRENQDKIKWKYMSSNPGIFEYRRVSEHADDLRDLRW